MRTREVWRNVQALTATLLVTVGDACVETDGSPSRKLHFVTLYGDIWVRGENGGLTLVD